MPAPRLLLIALAAVLTMSAVPVLVKSNAANAVTIGIARLGIAVAVFSPLVLWRGHLARLSRAQWAQLTLIGGVFGVHWLCYFVSVKLATPAIAALAITTYGVQYMLLAWLFNGERAGPPECLALVVSFAGCVLVSPELSLENATTRGIAVGLFSAFLYAMMPLLHQRAAGIGTLERTWAQFTFALLFFLLLWDWSDWSLSRMDVYQLLALGLLCTVVAHGLWVKASTELPAIYSGMIYYLYLPLAMLSSALFIGEPISGSKLLGCLLVVGASAALSLYRLRRQG